MRKTGTQEIQKFQKTVWNFFEKNGRTFPWRTLNGRIDPFHVLVSEIMLQQTQADRVVPKFEAFIQKFPTAQSLHEASVKEVLLAWQGLGYNRRALMLKKAAGEILGRFQGIVPKTVQELESLPGVGPYTARAVMAFAFNLPNAVIETNIRSVYIRHFFPRRSNVADAELLPLVLETVDRKNPRKWYSALMDYGAHLKRTVGNDSRKSTLYAKQAPFKGSLREVRGKILKTLGEKSVTKPALERLCEGASGQFERAFGALLKEGFIQKSGKKVTLAL